MTSNTHIPDP